MSLSKSVLIAPLCTALSLTYLLNSPERHSLAALSPPLLFLFSGLTCLFVSYVSNLQRVKDAEGARLPQRPFLEESKDVVQAKENAVTTPATTLGSAYILAISAKPPRSWLVLVLVLCVVIRSEIQQRVHFQQQCAVGRIECFLGPLLLCHEIAITRGTLLLPLTEDADDPWRTFWDDLLDWFSGPRTKFFMTSLGVLLVSAGTFYSPDGLIASTYICLDDIDNRSETLLLQFVSLAFDGAIIILAWRLLARPNDAETRLRILGSSLLASCLLLQLVRLAKRLIIEPNQYHVEVRPILVSEILVDGAALAACLCSTAEWARHVSPLTVATTITAILGLWKCSGQLVTLPGWLLPQTHKIVGPFWLIYSGAVLFFCSRGNTISFHHIRRKFVAASVLGVITTAVLSVFLGHSQILFTEHPITNLIYRSHIAHDRWLRSAHVSESLAVAVKTYEERHLGKAAPPGFSAWYGYAEQTQIIDDFSQIDSDLAPYWRITPEALREGAEAMTRAPGVLAIRIKNSEVTHDIPDDDQARNDLTDLVEMIRKFSEHLPDMTLPVNLHSSPRLLPSWEKVRQGAGLRVRNASGVQGPNLTTTEGHRQLQTEGCAPTSRARTNPYWGIPEFCAECVADHSDESLLNNWIAATETCAQPDLQYLHGFYLTSPQHAMVPDLFPLFSLAKTDSFSDILIPLPRMTRSAIPDTTWQFHRRYDTLHWRGKVKEQGLSNEYLHGNHKLRLFRLLNGLGHETELAIILPTDADQELYSYERVGALDASSAAPFSIDITNMPGCKSPGCSLKSSSQDSAQTDSQQDPLEYRYVLLLDEDSGPPKDMIRTLRSNSVPFVSSIFRTWYTERLRPWLHFVPIDPRYQALHTTYLYFTGTEDRAKISGRRADMKARLNDAVWIAQQGKRWADQVLGQRDMEVYMFRLLLEWGRLIDDEREKIGFRRLENGGFDHIGFTVPK